MYKILRKIPQGKDFLKKFVRNVVYVLIGSLGFFIGQSVYKYIKWEYFVERKITEVKSYYDYKDEYHLYFDDEDFYVNKNDKKLKIVKDNNHYSGYIAYYPQKRDSKYKPTEFETNVGIITIGLLIIITVISIIVIIFWAFDIIQL